MKATCLMGLAVALLLPLQVNAQQVTRYPDEGKPLTERISWAEQTGGRQSDSGFWAGYSISKFMHQDAWMGRIGGPNWTSLKSLYALLGREDLEELLPAELTRDLNIQMNGVIHVGNHNKSQRENEELFLKEIGVLVYYASRNPYPSDIQLTNMSLGVDLKGAPLYWLGKSSDDESTSYLQTLFKKAADEDFRSDILRSISVHENRKDQFDFFAGVLKTETSEEMREEAVFWIGQLNLPEGLALLQNVVTGDKSMDVREKAVFSISQMSSEAALDVLIDLARNADHRNTQKQAIFWLGQQASDRTMELLEEMAFDEDDTEVQGHAVFALAQMPADRSIPKLIEIATTHPNLTVRKKAIFWLGDSGDPRAVETLIALVKDAGE